MIIRKKTETFIYYECYDCGKKSMGLIKNGSDK